MADRTGKARPASTPGQGSSTTKAPGNAPTGKAGKSGTDGKGGKPVSRGKKWTFRLLKVAVVALVLGLVAGAAVIFVGYRTTDIPAKGNAEFETATTTVFYDNGKTELGTFEIQNRQPLTFDEMPQNIKDAVVAAENRDFWTDNGISIRGMARAAWTVARGGDLQGGSTITQQYIKIFYLTQDQTLKRKFREIFIAYKLNQERSKADILEGYLNTIYFGRGAYGIQAASQAFFDVDAKDLSVPQAAVLASVINNPSLFDPADDDNVERLTERYRYVLTSMAETGAITPERATKDSAKLPKFPKIKTDQRYGGPQGFLLKMVERELVSEGFDPSQISGGGLRVTTTFDKTAQDAAVKAAQTYTKQSADTANKKASDLHAAIASVKVGTGEVLALYGGPDYVKNSRNWATTARPTASTFKTYALAAGLKDGLSLRSTFNGNTFTPPGDTSTVRNEFSYQYGPVSLIRATAESINTAFVDLTTSMEDGPQKVADAAVAAGAPKGPGWDLNSRLPLGAAEVSPLNQANAYATYANDGTAVAQHVVKEVSDANGKVLYTANPEEKRAVSEDVARDVTYALEDVVEQGTGRSVQTLNRPVAGKTGTKDGDKNDITSAWFVAYTKQISTAVMYVAGDSGSKDLDAYKRPGDQTFFGGTYPAMTWIDYMATATEDQPVKRFAEPAYVNAGSSPQPIRTQRAPSRTAQPSATRSGEPTQRATSERSATTSSKPTESKSTPSKPTASKPTKSASSEPTKTSSAPKTSKPPTTKPTEPTKQPRPEPSSKPTASATRQPTRQPTKAPPTSKPTTKPTTKPTSKPTTKPTDKPTKGGGNSGGDTGGTDQSGGDRGGGDLSRRLPAPGNG